ncbi:MAG: glycosyltransferase family 2 protein [Gemmatimonadales bacterium]|nr:glycosyltransferase family 2 protein [Gemmatimonadales bacterium]
MEHTPQLSIVIPAYNEAACLGPLLGELNAALAGGPTYEVLCVDDGSTDGTLEVLRSTRERLPQLRIVRHHSRSGQSAALWTGFGRAKAPWIATLDADGQNDPRDLPRLLEARDASPEREELWLVTGIRRKRRDTLLKRVSSRVANAVRGRLLRDGISDTGCGLKLMHRARILTLPRFDHMHRFLPALVMRSGGRVLTVEVGHRPRTAGTTKYGVRNRLFVGVVDLLGVLWLQRRTTHPIIEEEL